jgi:hypothetical protein
VDWINLAHDRDQWLALANYQLLKKDFVLWS